MTNVIEEQLKIKNWDLICITSIKIDPSDLF